MKEFKIHELSKEEKVIYYIKSKFPNMSSSSLYKAFRNKDIKINGKRISDTNTLVKNNDTICIYLNDEILFNLPKQLYIPYEDENILIAFKPQGIISNYEKETNTFEPSFEEYVKKFKGSNIFICHRLDTNTSGLIIFAKNETTYMSILNGFKAGYINKEYIAYVYDSNFSKDYYHYENYILKDERTGFSKIYNQFVNDSQKIITDIYVQKKYKKENYAILKVLIHTGKTHQIRALLSSINHPIIGDSKYGRNDINKHFKKNRQLLFATKYSFNFNKNDFLHYLNNICITLDESYYKDKL